MSATNPNYKTAMDVPGFAEEKPAFRSNPVIAALANKALVCLREPLRGNAALEPVLLFSEEGKRIYRHSICYLLAAAADYVFPGRRLIIGHSLGDGFFYHFAENETVSSKEVSAIEKRMEELVEAAIPITYDILSYQEALVYFRRKGFDDTHLLLSFRNDPEIPVYRMGDFVDTTYEPLVQNTSVLSCWELCPYGDGMLLRYPENHRLDRLAEFKDNPKLFSVFTEYREWEEILGITGLGGLNRISNEGDTKEFILMCEALQAKKIASVADTIASRKTVKTVFIAGPSSSNKTTFAKKLAIQLKVLGMNPQRISLDDYYFTKDKVPRDEDGKPDLECLEAIDTALFKEQLSELYSGFPVRLPRFEFNWGGIGRRTFADSPITLKENSVLLVEGIHGLNPSLMEGFNPETVFKVYISALAQINIDEHNRISITDGRIIRRVVRDYRSRGASALDTLNMFPSVQRGEDKYIFPFSTNADVMINSALDYELAVLAPFAKPLLRTVKPSDGPSYLTARRILKFLDLVHAIPESMVPSDSMLREFIGGSAFGD